MDNEKEIWKSIDEVEGRFTRYEVSNKGRVRSIRQVYGEDAYYKILKPEQDTREGFAKYGRYVRLRFGGSMRARKCRIARLVAKYFIPNPDNLPYVIHVGDISDDSQENIMWSNTKFKPKPEYELGVRRSYDIRLKDSNRILACGVMAATPKLAVMRWHIAESKILDFERTYGIIDTSHRRVYINGEEVVITLSPQ